MRILRFLEKDNRDTVFKIISQTVSKEKLLTAETPRFFDIIIMSEDVELECLKELVRPYFGEVI